MHNRLIITLMVIVPFGLNVASAQSPSTISNSNFTNASDPIVVPECRLKVAHEVELSCERGGVLDFVAEEGSQVQQGQVIVLLRDAVARATYAIAEKESANDIEVRFARKASELAQLKYERAQQADRAVSGTVTEFELRELRLAAERSLLQLQQAQHQFSIAALKKSEQAELLQSFQISAPFAGLVRVVHKRPGEYVPEGDVVIEVVNDQFMRVEGYVSLADLDSISVGNPVQVLLPQADGTPRRFTGQVRFVDTQIDPVSLQTKVSAEVRNSNSMLKDGMLATMVIARSTSTSRSNH